MYVCILPFYLLVDLLCFNVQDSTYHSSTIRHSHQQVEERPTAQQLLAHQFFTQCAVDIVSPKVLLLSLLLRIVGSASGNCLCNGNSFLMVSAMAILFQWSLQLSLQW